MNNSRVRRNDTEVVQSLLAPLQELISLLVTLKLKVAVDQKRRFRTVSIHLNRVVDNQLYWLQRVDLRRIAAQSRHRIAHRRKVYDARNACKVLQNNPRRSKADLLRWLRLRVPSRQSLDVRLENRLVVLKPQQVLQKHLLRVRQPRDVKPLRLQRFQRIVGITLAPNFQRTLRLKTVQHSFPSERNPFS